MRVRAALFALAAVSFLPAQEGKDPAANAMESYRDAKEFLQQPRVTLPRLLGLVVRPERACSIPLINVLPKHFVSKMPQHKVDSSIDRMPNYMPAPPCEDRPPK